MLHDIPFASLKYVLTPENTDPEEPRYEPHGILLTKKFAYDKGCRPVLYLSNKEVQSIAVPKDELWRVVRFEVSNENWISWLHERELRCVGNFKLPSLLSAVLVKNAEDADRLRKKLDEKPKSFKVRRK
jgi:hypothetical protein